ncbi:unnamed protein product (macronuclear) [Paramecium tetraurelia]|uniref:Calponin-homology (CH) domain-containing protein n=1 Tax=Paramecium tetraurelia TaxID=5888 RepID=A0EI10_PARTE|nr:uncharacterized protein GSPATT00027278001 [Paramecium tetraurelia]CAK94951.1 unnamed protein product [Paramecium tetraurelia]|eukprot:XP_001462324.1 hypothetical protein (macronuclear) [Paramecium tetraurelia strain d4-2]
MSATTNWTTSKNDLIKWINETFKLTITQLEALGTGCIFCQIFEYFYPNSIQSNKVVWKANTEVEFIKNFKTLAEAFTKLNISKSFDIQNLSKARYQDLLDLAIFFKTKFDKQAEKRTGYDPLDFRKGEEKKIIITQNRKPVSALKDKTNLEDSKVSPQSVLVKRSSSKAQNQRRNHESTDLTKTPQLSSITEIVNNTEDDEATKVKKIKQLFI